MSVVTHGLFVFIFILASSSEDIFSNDTLLNFGKIAIIAVVILIVSIPEGLPLAISIAMALSINNLKEDQILIKNLEAVQTCAMIHDLCIGKTGTLTEGGSEGRPMRVTKYHIIDSQNVSEVENMFKMVPFIDLVKECIISNTDVRIETTETNFNYELRGSAIEVGLVNMLLEQGIDIQMTFLDRNENCDKVV